ncbi:BREX-2 system adenine-specific DNA-methyltransferase PglX [Hahella chejuensis]|nr:BREX-2 system adenine-specific DNA-methyltransferase PglX [Hahella chejuensis]
MIDRQQLLKDLQRELPKLEKDILAYNEQSMERTSHLKQEYAKAKEAGRTAEHFVSWREAQITQAAVAWVLTCVFVRFLEDNGLLAQPVLAGPVERESGPDSAKSHPLKNAKDRIEAYFNAHPTHAEREYLLQLFEQLEKIPVIAELLDHRHNPLWQIPVSADGAKSLIDFFQKIDPETGQIIHDFTDPNWDTRFLGDLYQDLSEAVRKRYALLQTPEFVESFILDYTLEPAIKTFGLEGLRLIDPTCGSGHFLLTTFERIFERWQKREPGTNSRVLAQRALDVVHGVDINPYAIAICRFRLLMAAMKACDIDLIKDAPAFHFNLACGDSLLHGRRFEWQGQGIQQGLLDDEIKHVFEAEDLEKLNKILGEKPFHVVVGNPPYITVKDKALGAAYRDKYPTCHRQFSLGVPFTERFFDLAFLEKENQSAGFVGMITANSFMKREFGKKLIEELFQNKDLTHVIDTSGAYIPGHGTPTVILLARNQKPRLETVRAALGIRGEPSAPKTASQGKVWRSIVDLLPKVNSENEFISIVDQPREFFLSHPWSVGGGGATELKILLEENSTCQMEEVVEPPIGRGVRIAEEDIFIFSPVRLRNSKISLSEFRGLLIGEHIRDWTKIHASSVWYPYFKESSRSKALSILWAWKTTLANRKTFQGVMADAGLRWYDYMQHTASAYQTSLSITFAFVATHNHFVLDRGGNVFNRTAPVIKLPTLATETDHFGLLALLNSSTACFWGRQTFFGRGGFSDGKWQERMEWDGTKLKAFPVVEDTSKQATLFAKQIDSLTKRLESCSPSSILNQAEDQLYEALSKAKETEYKILREMIALQEELDWFVYYLYGLTKAPLCCEGELPEIDLGQRAFEIVLARKINAGELKTVWFEHHCSKPNTEIPSEWPEKYRDIVNARINEIKENESIKLIDNKDHKRRWARDSWDDRLKLAAKDWLLDCIQKLMEFHKLSTCAQLADKVREHKKARQVAAIYTRGEDFDFQTLVSDLVASDNVPQTAADRIKPAAMEKYRAWQETWEKQRLEDAIDAEFGVDRPLSEVDSADESNRAKYEEAKRKAEAKKAEIIGDIPLPPQYKQSDFRKASYWPLRGKLDVPKERFFSLPGCEKDGDNTLVIGWAGLNHLQRAQAIAAWYEDRKENDGWEAERLMPMLVAIDELIPWLKQWHNDIDPEYGERMGDFYESYLLEELRRWELTREELLDWRPPTTTRRRR